MRGFLEDVSYAAFEVNMMLMIDRSSVHCAA